MLSIKFFFLLCIYIFFLIAKKSENVTNDLLGAHLNSLEKREFNFFSGSEVTGAKIINSTNTNTSYVCKCVKPVLFYYDKPLIIKREFNFFPGAIINGISNEKIDISDEINLIYCFSVNNEKCYYKKLNLTESYM